MADILRTSSLEDHISDALRDCYKEAREEPGYKSFGNKDQVLGASKDYC